MFRGAIASVISELIRQERLVLIDDFGVDAPKTKQLVGKLKQLGLDNVLIIKDQIEDNLFLAARNLAGVDLRDTDTLDPVSLIRFEKVLITVPALKRVEEWLA
jgi:large subunit ribosomal protein L4